MKTGADLILEVCRKYPETPTLTLAKKVYRENSKFFTGIENARSMIRYYRGQHGEEHRKEITDKSLFKADGSYDPFKIPESDAKPRHPVKLDGGKFLALYDLHIPYHDKPALETAIKEGIRQGCDAVFLGGDVIDCYQISSWVRDPNMRDFGGELDLVRSFLGYLRRQFPKARLYYKEGNHEERYWKYMRVKAPELLNIKAISLQSLLNLEELGYIWINGRTKANIGKLSVFHGHEFGKSVFSPVNSARGLYLRAKASSIWGHVHSSSEHTEKDVNDKIITCWSIGGLSELSPEYSPYNKWNHGFAIIERNGDEFHVENYRILNGKIL